MLQVNLLGSVQVQLGPTSISFLADQRYQLLAYLAHHRDWVSREQLHYLFWSERSDKQAKDNLRQLLRRVRALDLNRNVPSGLIIERGRLCWCVETDTHAFAEAIREMRWRDALEHYRGPFLSGLELAAGWVRLMPLIEIADELAKSSDFLESSRSKVARHRSLRAVFEHSWRLLNPEEQTVLKKLSVFVGGFNRNAAAEVAGASLPILAALADKSLLKVSDAGRYHRHMLVYEYSREKLAEEPGEYAQTEARHGDYFMRFLADQRRVLRGAESQVAFGALDGDRENVRAAWQWAVRRVEAEHIRHATFALSNYLARRARFQEAQGFFRSAAAVLDGSDPRERHALAAVLTEESWHSYQLGHYAEAERLAERGLVLAEAAADSTITVLALNALGCTANKTGAYKKAQRYHRRAVSFPKGQQQPTLQGNLLNNTAIVERSLGNYQEARAYAQEALECYRLSGNRVDRLHLPLQFGEISLYQNRLDDAKGYFTEGLAQARALGVQSRISDFLVMLARTLYELGAFGESLEHCREAQKMMQANGGQSRDSSALKNTLGRLAAAQDDKAAAYTLFGESLRTAWSRGELPKVLETLVYLAELWLKEARVTQAAELLSLAQAHPGSEYWLREHARKLLAGLEPSQQAQSRKNPLSLTEVPSRLAEWLHLPELLVPEPLSSAEHLLNP